MAIPTISGLCHLSAPPKAGSTSFALQQARLAIADGKRVIWGSEAMPDNIRFSQIFCNLDISAASRFHGMSTAGEFKRCIIEIGRAARILPNVGLVVIDGWTPPKGRVSSETKSSILELASNLNKDCNLLLTSQSYADAAGGSEYVIRGEKILSDAGFDTWKLVRPSDDARRILTIEEKVIPLLLEEEGFKLI
jgi:hypothetical protein